MYNYRGKSEEYKEYTAYNECHEEFKNGEFPFGLFGSIDFGCSSTRCQCYQHKLPVAVCILISPTDSLDIDQLTYHLMNMH